MAIARALGLSELDAWAEPFPGPVEIPEHRGSGMWKAWSLRGDQPVETKRVL
jgi:hypothetical protein